MHPKNRYHADHDFPALARVVPELTAHFITTPDGRISLDFPHPDAVLQLNRALLLRDYQLKFWNLPPGSLCPGVPGRLDYVHVIADLLKIWARPPVPGKNSGEQKKPAAITGLDIGTGASLIYPILGSHEYGWHFVGTDVEDQSLKVARALVDFNPRLADKITLRKQADGAKIFSGVIRGDDRFAFSTCNPPFYANADEAKQASEKKWAKLGNDTKTGYNFGGRANELWTPGGEPAFLRRMIKESKEFAQQVGWFTTLVSQKSYLRAAKELLGRAGATVKIIPIGQGGKIRRVLAWHY
ncbi:23S rRNA (adenine(1618)-N(6))-methyltransferase RlmF [Neolewinella antarctica]|uniref:23S rRNA (Adenine1618-N6)-methyltransferase n=1 Tax=Neolewinella antarctica TaxID=442734 RepID=A0ABX0X8A1_9BACT|nr:23S rRNA (adenine(1618)-N(6))-methyltransferase RlmF [Neolewinella antarctica]NJC25265.1 23S rRNA (adenine1618-N6)-methyltransferase [Neolewinella antarctica]